MGAASLQGSLSSSYTPPDGVENDYIDGNDLPTSPDVRDRVVQTNSYKDAVDLGSAVDDEIFGSVRQALQAYTTGSQIAVTYYRKNTDAGVRDSDSENNDDDSVHDTYQRINGFILKVSDQLSYDYASEENEGNLSGSAVALPGVTPKVGDFYLYEVESGSWGKFVVTNVNRLSIRSTTCYEIAVRLSDWVDTADIVAIEEKVVSVLYFDLEAFMDGSKAMLLTDEKVMLDDCRKLLKDMLSDYWREFMDTSVMQTLMHPAEDEDSDPYYDPYIVKFLEKYTPWNVARPQQLIRDPSNYNYSYWYGLENPGRLTTTQMYSKYTLETCEFGSRDTHVTSLINKEYVVLTTSDDEDGENYISDGLQLTPDPLEDFDSLVRLYVEQEKMDAVELLTQAEAVGDLDAADRFYRLPVYYYLLRVLERHLVSGQLREYTAPSAEYGPTSYEFTSDDLVDGWLVMFYSSPVISICDPEGTAYVLADEELVYPVEGDTTHIDIDTMLTRLTLTMEEDETWTVVMSGVL